MILVTIGMNESPYGPLFAIMDEYAARTGEEVVIQTGQVPFEAKHCRTFTFLPDAEMQAVFDEADLIVMHAGIGSILNGLKRNIPLVLVPRNAVEEVSESDQQLIVARKVESLGRAVVVTDLEGVVGAISAARKLEFPPYKPNSELCDFLSQLLRSIESGETH